MQTNITVGEVVGTGFGAITAVENAGSSPELLAEQVEKSMVPVDPSLPSCCIDGRRCVHVLGGAMTQPRPAVAGGALVTSYAAAEMINWFQDDASPLDRLKRVNALLKINGLTAGTHGDMAAYLGNFTNPETKQPKTGCGADDRKAEIMDKLYVHSEIVESVTQTLLGFEYDQRFMAFAPQENITNHANTWDPTDVIAVVGEDSPHGVEILESEHTPTHGHREIAVVFNYKENTTLDRDSFVDATGQQVFKVDMWYINRLAKALASGPDAAEQYEQLVHAMTAYQVATYLTLCDGSQRVIIAA